MKNLPAWVSNYIGIPFVSGGREIDSGLDCYGLFRLIQNIHYGKNIPDLSGAYDNANNFEQTKEVFTKHQPIIAGIQIKEPEDGCAVVLRYGGHPLHIGTYIAGHILHSLPEVGSILSLAADLEKRIEGYYLVN